MKTLADYLDPQLRKLYLDFQSPDHHHDHNKIGKKEVRHRPSFILNSRDNDTSDNVSLTQDLKRPASDPRKKPFLSWEQRESKDKGWALKCFCTNNILLAKNRTKKVSHLSVNGSHKLFIQSADGNLPYGSALKIILWLCDQAYKTKSVHLIHHNLKQALEQIGLTIHHENRKMFVQVLSILRKTTFCYTEGKKLTTGNFRIVESYSYKDDPRLGNKLVIKLTTEFLQLFDNKKFIRAFDYEVVRRLGGDYTTLHFYLFSLQRTYKKGPEAHIRIQEFLHECGSVFRDSVAFFRKIKDVVIPKLVGVLQEVYHDSFEGLFETKASMKNKKNKMRRIVIKMGKLLIPSRPEPLKGFLKRCHQLIINYGLLGKEKLTNEERERLSVETGQRFEELVKLSPQKLQRMLLLT